MSAETIVTLILAALPLSGSLVDHATILRAAGCDGRGRITIAQTSPAEWTVIVRCTRTAVPTADILRTDRWEAAHPVFTPCPLGACGGL